MVDILRGRAELRPDSLAYAFLADGETESARLSFAGVDREARAIGALLRDAGMAGERVLLLYPQGLAFVSAFYGCLYAGAVAVPAYPPRNERGLPRLRAILDDCRPRAVLGTSAVLAEVGGWLDGLPGADAVLRLATDDLPASLADDWRDPGADPGALAFLQYTSGSTATPKGVMVSHANLLHNLELLRTGWRQSSGSVVVSWLPLFHDMGLIGNVLESAYLGAPCVLMSPASFLQKPVRWLRAVSRYGATLSGGPNFAFDLCVERIPPEQRAGLDLGRWSAAFNGAEPVRADTLARFHEAFAPYGFRREALQPGYGLAEGTLVVSAGREEGTPPLVRELDAATLEQGRLAPGADGEATRLQVGCGRVLGGQRVAIVDPETCVECPPDVVGEVWVSGPSVAAGYWGRSGETEETFGARLAGGGGGPFLRTGDLGFLHGGELFITGRAKDLIVVRGRNHYPQDIERTAERSHAGLRSGCSAAFGVERGAEERLVVAAEVDRHALRGSLDEIVEAVRRAVVEEHELAPSTIVLLKPGGVSKTTSGKIQRRGTRERFLEGTLDPVRVWEEGDAVRAPAPSLAEPGWDGESVGTPGVREIESWLVARVAERTGIPARSIDRREPFAGYGLDSVAATGLSGELEAWLGRRLSPTLLYEHPSIGRLARFLAGVPERAGEAAPAGPREGGDAEPVAIVGIGCRFPGADGPDGFWRLLRDGADAVTEVPPSRWDLDALYDPDPQAPGRMSTRWGGFLSGIDRFDAAFFSITPREAMRMDPQQRLLLEVAWEALEDAGLSPDRLRGTETGVFVGISGSDYGQLQFSDPALSDAYAGTGGALSIAANRISYALDLRGPSLAVDTACSSSLVAVHLACRSLAEGECEMALVGGVNLLVSPGVTVNFSKAGFMSPDGRCRAFDAGANGYVRGEGAGVVVLKPLSRAVADGDPVYAVIRGTAVNQDGRSNGLTAPSRAAQEAVLRAAYRRAGASPGDVGYVEAHGTGTPLGDPIEAAALGAVLAEGRAPGDRCAVGSAKTNLGHLEAAAGIAGVIKVALSLRNGWIPASLHFRAPNPEIPFDRLPLRVQAEGGAWEGEEGHRLAGVSSFGFGGTNAHAVLAGAPAIADSVPGADPGGPVLLPLSARAPEALYALALRYRAFLDGECAGTPLADLARAAGTRRAHLDHRLAVVGASHAEIAERLDDFLAGETHPGAAAGNGLPGEAPRVAFVFSGQGAQWWGMGRELAEREPVFRGVLEECDRLLRRHVPWSLLEELGRDEAGSHLGETEVAQPALFSLQVALAALWRSWGVEPAAVAGHSVGEVAAACVSGALGLEDAVRIVAHRGRLMQRAAGRGAMATVGLAPDDALRVIAPYASRLSVAAFNDPASSVLSGDREVLEAVLERLEARGDFVRRMPGGYAFHSAQMEPFAGELARACEGIAPGSEGIPFVSTLEGRRVAGTDLVPAYWSRNLREPVRFAEAVRALTEEGCDAFLEVGPHPVLVRSVERTLAAAGASGVALPTLRREAERETMLGSLGALYALGAEVAWGAVGGGPARYLKLPTYPWQHESYWLEPAADAARPVPRPDTGAAGDFRFAGHTTPAQLPGTHLWEATLLAQRGGEDEPDLALPALVTAVEDALRQVFGPGPHRVDGLSEVRLPGGRAHRLQLVLAFREGGDGEVFVYSRPEEEDAAGGGWTERMRGSVRLREAAGPPAAAAAPPPDLDALRAAPEAERAATIEAYLRAALGRVLRIPATRLDPERPVTRLGLDSLMAVEFRNAVERDLRAALPLKSLFAGPSLRELAADLLARVGTETDSVSERGAILASGDEHPLSHGQRAAWFLQQLAPGSAAFNVAAAARVAGALDVDALGRALQGLLDRHSALRSTFPLRGETPVQRTRGGECVAFARVDASGWSEARLAGHLSREAHRPFDLASGPLFRAELLARAPVDHVLLLAMHHVVTDFWSNVLLLRELTLLYAGEAAGVPVELPAPGAGYADFVRRQDEMLSGPEGDRLRAYWDERLTGELPVLRLPSDRPRPAERTDAGAVHRFRVDTERTARVGGFAREHGTTPFVVLLAAYQALLHRYSGEEDVLVASPAAGRSRAEFEGTVGYFMNPVLLRGDLSGRPSFHEVLVQVRETVVGALQHQDFPLPLLAERIPSLRDPGRPGPFQAMFVFNRPHRLEEAGIAGIMVGEPGARFEHGGLVLESFPFEETTSPCDLCLWMAEVDGGLSARFQYSTALFDSGTVERLTGSFVALLDGLLAGPERALHEVPLLGPEERDRLIAGWSEGERGPPVGASVHERFEARAALTPEAIALAWEGGETSYADLNRSANRLAAYLRERGVGPDVRVGLCLERSAELIVGILGILMAGGAYLPIDPAYPAERRAWMLADAGAAVLVTRRRLAAELDDGTVEVVAVDADRAAIAARPSGNPAVAADPESLAYVIYTSGSTGTPKGVMVRHASLSNHTASAVDAYALSPRDRVLQFASVSFDASVEEIFPTLAAGGALVLRPERAAGAFSDFAASCGEAGITVLDLPTAYWHQLVGALQTGECALPPSVRLAIIGGERALPERVDAWRACVGGVVRLVNTYGPTETTVVATRHELEGAPTAGREVPIGRAIRNLRCHVLDEGMNPVPAGVPGQLLVGGVGLARGYLGRPDLTAGRFLPDPFSGLPGERLYATGDRVRWLPTGSLEFLGRTDGQVKVRGFRIEPGEVEHALRRHPDVADVAVVAREDAPGQRRLVAYVVAGRGPAPPLRELREFLGETVPEYMVPSAFVFLDGLPLTHSGKVDRRALPAPERGALPSAEGYVAPRNTPEEVLAGIWESVLDRERVGVHDNFFELGGDSILAVQVISRAGRAGLRLTPGQVFQHPTVAGAAAVAVPSSPYGAPAPGDGREPDLLPSAALQPS